MATMDQYLPMDKLVQEKLIQYLEDNLKEVKD
jgi:hypothetical protein